MRHLNVRVAWHDNKWNGTICRDPVGNSFCVDLERIRESRDEVKEVKWAGKRFSELEADDLPPPSVAPAPLEPIAPTIRIERP